MIVLGLKVQPEWVAAGLAAMKGEFRKADVELAIVAAGCPSSIRRKYTELFADCVVDRLLVAEKRAGRITYDGRMWSAIA